MDEKNEELNEINEDLEKSEAKPKNKPTESGANNMVKAYAIFSQGLVTMIVLGVIGFFIGFKVDKKSALPGILAVIGGLIGLINFIYLVYKNHYFDGPIKKNENGDGEDNEKGQ